MKVSYELSISEIKALLELIQELCKRNGLDEAITRTLFHKMNERHLK